MTPVARHGDAGSAALVVAAAAAAALAAPAAVRAPLVIVASAAVVLRVAPLRRRGVADAALVGAGALLVLAVLLGIVLNVAPGGLNRVSWAVGYAVLGLAALAVGARRRGRPAPVVPDADTGPTGRDTRPAAGGAASTRGRRSSIATLAVAAVVAAAAIAISVRATNDSEHAPTALSVTAPTARTLTLTVSSGDRAGPFRLTVRAGDGPSRALGEPFHVAAGAAVSRQLSAPTVRTTVALIDVSTGRSVRTVIVGGSP